MYGKLFENHRHKFVLPRGDERPYVIEEVFPLVQFLERVELFLPISGRTVLIDMSSDLEQLLAAFEASDEGQTVGPCISDEFHKARLIKVWLDHDPPEDEIEALYDALPEEAQKGLTYGVLETLYARGELGTKV